MGTATYGMNVVGWEARIDVERLRTDRLARLKDALDRSEAGSLLTFDFHNIRYMTATHIGTWAIDKMIRFPVLPRGGEPVLWDFGSAARHHQIYAPWLDYRSDDEINRGIVGHSGARAGISLLRGAFSPASGIAESVAAKIYEELERYGMHTTPVGVDILEIPVMEALRARGLEVIDGQQIFLEARRIKTSDEITLLTTAASMVDAAYDDLYAFLHPGVRENEAVGLVSKKLYDLGSEHVEGVNAISGEACSPHPDRFFH